MYIIMRIFSLNLVVFSSSISGFIFDLTGSFTLSFNIMATLSVFAIVSLAMGDVYDS